MIRVLRLLNLNQRSVWAEFCQGPWHRDHPILFLCVSCVICCVFFNIIMPLRFIFWSCDESIIFVVWLHNMNLCKLLFGLLLQSFLKIRIVIVHHVHIFDAKVSQALFKSLLLLSITLSLWLCSFNLIEVKF